MQPLNPNEPPARHHVHIRGLDSRLAVVVLVAVFSVVGIGLGVAYEISTVVASGAAPADVQNAMIRAGVIALVLTIIAAWGALTIGDILLLRRVRRMVEEMRHVALGDSNDLNRIPGGMGELDELALIFDRMRRRMVDATQDTNEKVLTRTADLEFSKGMAEFEQARTEALISSIGEAVIATDKEGRIIFINQEVQKAMGWTVAELVGKKEEDMIVIKDDKDAPLPQESRPTRIALATGEKAVLAAFPKPHQMSRKDGTTYPVQVTVTPVLSGGNLIGAIEVIRDITSEAELDRRKTEFISIASHQLRAPLAATKWLSDMLRKGDVGKLQGKQQELADKLYEANERMVVLVNELLNMSRLDSGVSKPVPKNVPSADLLKTLMNDSQPLLTEKKQSFAYEGARVLPQIFVDPLLIREVLMNLISNASKYSPDGGVVTLGAQPVQNMLRISIADTGIGIPKADQGQLFKKFFRAGNALKSAVQGTGLGLYFVKSIIELSGGQIWFESEEDKGTTFFVTLPLAAKP